MDDEPQFALEKLGELSTLTRLVGSEPTQLFSFPFTAVCGLHGHGDRILFIDLETPWYYLVLNWGCLRRRGEEEVPKPSSALGLKGETKWDFRTLKTKTGIFCYRIPAN